MEDLISFLKSRGIEEEIITHFQTENIDCAAISVLDDNSLKILIPKYGDRVALRDYCRRQSGPKKYSIIEKIKNKIALKNAMSEENKNSHLSHTTSSQRKTRIITLGWVCSNDEGQMKKVRARQGGGTREVAMPVCSTMVEVEQKAIDFFFPNKISPRGHISQFEVKLLDFKHNEVEKEWTVEGIYKTTGVNRLRFYLSTIKIKGTIEKITTSYEKSRHSSGSDFEDLPPKRTSKYIISDDENESENLYVSNNPVRDYLFSFVVDETEGSQLTGTSNTASTGAVADFENLTTDVQVEEPIRNYSVVDLTEHYECGETNFILPSLPEGAEHLKINLKRDNCVEELFTLYKDPSVISKKIEVSFVGEEGVDGGGLTRELFNLFFIKVESDYFRGEDVIVPFLPLNKVRKLKDNFIAIGRIIEHMILITGSVPSKISRITFLMIKDQEQVIDDKLILEEFLLYVNPCERHMLHKALNNFSALSKKENDIIINMFNCYQFYELPKEHEIRDQIISIAKDVLIEKTRSFVQLIRQGVSLDTYSDLWTKCDFSVLIDIERPTPAKIANCLTYSSILTNEETMAFHYLEMYVRCMDQDKLKKFLFFVTGSYQLPEAINIGFTKLQGIERRPLVHTCSNLLEISSQYSTYQDFKNEFDMFLMNECSFQYNSC